MPFSYSNCDSVLEKDLITIQPMSCFDVGIGHGKIGSIVRRNFIQCDITGFEIHKPYITDGHYNIYDAINIIDFYDWIQQNVDWAVDLIVFGDVLEHMFKSKVFDILDMCCYRAKWIVAIIPDKALQNTYEGNIKEAHISSMTLQELSSYNVAHYVKIDNISYYLIKGFL